MNRNALQRVVPQEEVVTVQDVAREAWEESKGDALKATDLMVAKVKKDQRLFDELMGGLVRSACYEAISKAVRLSRANVWTPPNQDAGGSGDRVRTLAAGNALMFFPLPGGKMLAQATRAEVEAASTFYGKQAADMGQKARWLSLVADQVEEGKPVQSCLTEQQLIKLQEQACNGQ